MCLAKPDKFTGTTTGHEIRPVTYASDFLHGLERIQPSCASAHLNPGSPRRHAASYADIWGNDREVVSSGVGQNSYKVSCLGLRSYKRGF